MAVSSLVPAAAGPTISDIQTAVSTYSKSPLDITWTQIGYVNGSGASSVSFTGLGGYKYLRLIGTWLQDTNADLRIRFNNDATGNNYNFHGNGTQGTSVFTTGFASTTSLSLANAWDSVGANGSGNGVIVEFMPAANNNSSIYRAGKWICNYRSSTPVLVHSEQNFVWNSNAQITSMQIQLATGLFNSSSYMGFYMYGGN